MPDQRLANPERRAELESASADWAVRDLSQEQTDALELYLRGAVSSFAIGAVEEQTVLCDPEGVRLAVLHPGGEIDGLQLPTHHDFAEFRKSPVDLSDDGAALAFFADQPIGRATIMALLEKSGDARRLLILASGIGERRFHLMRCLKLLPLGDTRAEIVLLPLGSSDAAEVAESFGATLVSADELEVQGEGELAELPALTAELERQNPAPSVRGLTVFFTGLSGSGKSTISQIVEARLREFGDRPVTSLDGDIVRKTLSSGLGFSREDRNLNILRIGWVAAQINKNRGLAICAPIAPYDEIRKEVRAMSEAHGAFVLVHVATPLEVCEARDRKGLYAKARAGIIKEFTGISDPYEEPGDAEIVLQTTELSAIEAADVVLSYLREQGFIA